MIAYSLRQGNQPRPTPRPTEAELRAFAQLVPSAFRPKIAGLERGRPRSPRPVPMAIGIADGASIRIVPPAGSGAEPHYVRFGQIHYDGTYLAPPVPVGREIVPVSYESPGGWREIRLVVSGGRGVGTPKITDHEEPVLTEGENRFVDLGPLPAAGGRYVLNAPGSTCDGFGILQPKGPAPRKIAMAPAELPAGTPAEAEGYALLFDQAVVWRWSDPMWTMTAAYLPGPSFVPKRFRGLLFRRWKETSASLDEYRITTFAHVYVRHENRWRYARTWWLEANGAAWIAEDEPAFRREFTTPILGRPSPIGGDYGTPKRLKNLRAVPLKP